MFSQIVAAISNFMAHLRSCRGYYAFRLPSQQNGTKITPEIKFSSVVTKQQQDLIQQ